jgi:hypothetical protein
MTQGIADRFYTGELEPATLTEAVSFLRFAVMVERETQGSQDIEIIKNQFAFILDAVQRHIPADLWHKVMDEVRTQVRGKPTPALEPARSLFTSEPSVLETIEEEVEAETRKHRPRVSANVEEEE